MKPTPPLSEENRRINRMRRISVFIFTYLIFSFVWWTFLLLIKNQDAYQSKYQLLAERQSPAAALEQIQKDYSRQRWMVLGESAASFLVLMTTFYFLNRGYRREVIHSRQQRNFLLSITHELKSPLASIQLALETLQRHALTPEQSGLVTRQALAETGRLNRLISDILLSARLEAAYRPERTPIDLTELLEDILAQYRAKFPHARFFLHPAPEGAWVLGEASLLQSVASNLLENAVKYADLPQPEIIIRLANESNHLRWEIADNGPGIPHNLRNLIFDRFFRAQEESIRTTKGAGLGLSIVRDIVRSHRGRISVTDNHPRGALFIIELPLANPS